VTQLDRVARAAAEQGDATRAAELFASALAVAEAALPAESLIIASLLFHVAASVADADCEPGAHELDMQRRCLVILHARMRAGTLRTPAPEEASFLSSSAAPGTSAAARVCGLSLYVDCAVNALQRWPRTAGDDRALQGAHGALRAALDALGRGELAAAPPPPGRPSAPCEHPVPKLDVLLQHVFADDSGLLLPLRSRCGLRRADEARLRELMVHRRRARTGDVAAVAPRLAGMPVDELLAAGGEHEAAPDVALRAPHRCALASCDAAEPEIMGGTSVFQVCARCRTARYCSSAHAAQDWRRHKRMECHQGAGVVE
jgi:hypothetical protein